MTLQCVVRDRNGDTYGVEFIPMKTSASRSADATHPGRDGRFEWPLVWARQADGRLSCCHVQRNAPGFGRVESKHPCRTENARVNRGPFDSLARSGRQLKSNPIFRCSIARSYI